MNLREKINIVKEKPLLLFSPLDWGLGHTVRSIALIREFASQGFKILVACNSTQKAILSPELPEVGFVDIKGYGVRYGRSGAATRLRILLQLPKILTQIKAENRWLSAFLKSSGVDLVVSDNRYGMYSNLVPSVIITHQLQVKSGFGAVADAFIRRFLYRYINRFDQCWIPDFETNSLSGELSHPVIMPRIPVEYIGILSRFEAPTVQTVPEYKCCIVLSGPEPQRTIFENIIIRQLEQYKQRVVLVRGLPGQTNTLQPIEGVEIFNYVSGGQLRELILKSEFVVCRSGYTSIMDLVTLNKKMVLVPTPGQTEQEYLAKYLSARGLAIYFKQNHFGLPFTCG